MGPQISVYDASNTSLVSNWNIGVLKAQVPSNVLTINIWNNKGGSTAVSDLKEAYLMVLDSNADTANEDVARDKWIQINEPSVDGNSDIWTPIGGSKGKDIKANSGVTDNMISGIANDGTAANSPKNVCTVNLRAVAPPNSNPGDKAFKVRLTGYFT
jgi:hypothetical protein